MYAHTHTLVANKSFGLKGQFFWAKKEIKITPHTLTYKQKPNILADEVAGFFYASLVLSSKHYSILVSKLTDYFEKIAVDGLSEFNLPVNRLVVKQNLKCCF